MDRPRFEGVTRLMAQLGTRRTALSLAAASGLAAASLGNGSAAAAKDEVSAERKRRGRRGKRGKEGPAGPEGPQGPQAGTGAVLVTKVCSVGGGGFNPGDTAECTATCADGYVATGGGFLEPKFIDELGIVRGSYPATTDNTPTGWIAQVEFINIGGTFNVTAFAVCAPT